MEARGGALEYFMHRVHRAARLQGEKTIDRFPRTTCRRLRGEANGVKIAPSPMAQP